MNAPGRARGIEAERSRDMLPDRVGGARAVEPHLATEEGMLVDVAEAQIGVGDGRAIASMRVACGPRVRTGALGTHAEQAKLVDPRDRTTAGADLDHFDDRHLQGQAAALGEAMHARHFELVRAFGLAIVDDAYFGGGAADIERDQVLHAGARTRKEPAIAPPAGPDSTSLTG